METITFWLIHERADYLLKYGNWMAESVTCVDEDSQFKKVEIKYNPLNLNELVLDIFHAGIHYENEKQTT